MSNSFTRDCRACGAPMVFVRCASRDGKWTPLDPEPVSDGNIVVNAAGEAEYLTASAQETYTGERFKSHFATCPEAERFRRRRS